MTTDRFNYAYDNLDRLVEFHRGELEDTSFDGILDSLVDPPASRSQVWDLDALGNMNSVTDDGGDPATRTHNKQNQINGLTYDANGNMTAQPTDFGDDTFSYDAWNRMASVAPDLLDPKTNGYDALGRRIVEVLAWMGDPNPVVHLYYSKDWQVVLEQTYTPPLPPEPFQGDGMQTSSFVIDNLSNRNAYVWSPVYVDAMVVRDHDAAADGVYEQRLYAQRDANFNVTAITDETGAVTHRFVYDPYGRPTILDATFVLTGNSFAWRYMHQGGRYDQQAGGQYTFRNRDLNVTFSVWMQQDPIRYIDGSNLYASWSLNPPSLYDSTGLAPKYTDEEIAAMTCPTSDAWVWGPPVGGQPSRPEGWKGLDQVFAEWYRQELAGGTGWTKGLEDCPCNITTSCTNDKNVVGENPDSDVWTPPGKPGFGYHAGALCMRSKKSNAFGARQQCCYDAAGQLITMGESAGTPDKASGFFEHQRVDVRPFDVACELRAVGAYLEVRPPNRGKDGSCALNDGKRNPVP